MEKNSQDFSLEDVMRLAQSPAAQQLMAALQAQNSAAVITAAGLAADGDYAAAQQALSSLLSSPEIQGLLRQLGE